MPLNFNRIKGLCFDVDGTLSDTDDAWVSRLSLRLHPLRFLFKNGDPQSFARWLVMTTESPMNAAYHLLDHLSLDDNFARIYSRLSQNRKKHHQPFQLMRGAVELLSWCHSNYPLTVVSARDEISTRRFLDQFELSTFFKEVVTSQTCEFTKPFPHPIHFAAKSMGLSAENCLMIGDTTVDILAGKAAGAQTVGLLCGFGTEKELRRAGADVILTDLSELRTLLGSTAQ